MKMGKEKDTQTVVAAIIAYAICSCSMLLINKLVMMNLHYPSLVACFQFSACLVVILVLKIFGVQVDSLEWAKVKPYLIYCFGFAGGIYSNMRVLESSNVETVIVFRSSTPLTVAVCDYLFLGREMPSKRSMCALASILVGAIAYVKTDAEFEMSGVQAYTWAIIYYCFLIFSMVWGKKLLSQIELRNKLVGSVYYTNIISIPIMFSFAYLKNEQTTFLDALMNLVPVGWVYLIISCIIGTGISYAGWWCRDVTSATTYTLIGVLNKLGTIAVSLLVMEDHASWGGVASLMCCIVGGSFYRAPPLRKPAYQPVSTEEDV